MTRFRIFCDAPLTKNDLDSFREGVAPHELLLPQTITESVVHQSAHDPGIRSADIIFGQPSLEDLLHSPQLRWIQLTTASFTRYDTPAMHVALAERNIVICNASDVYAGACAEHVFAFMLAQSRRLPACLQCAEETGSEDWHRFRHTFVSLRNQTVVILGYGTIAERLIELLAPFHMNILAFRRTPHGRESIPIVTLDTLPDALATADHVVNLLPHNAASQHFIDEERLDAMKQGAAFYNIGRGGTVDQNALVNALRSGRIAAAWLDVTEPEPLPENHPLRNLPNCFITPHIAGGHQNEGGTLVCHFLENLRRFEKGQPLSNRIMAGRA